MFIGGGNKVRFIIQVPSNNVNLLQDPPQSVAQ